MFTILIGIVAILYGIYLYLTWNYNYWKKRNLPHLPPVIGFGNLKDPFLMKRPQQAIHMEIYNKYPDYKYVGLYNMRQPWLFLRDIEIIRTIMIKDFSSFNSNNFELDEKNDPYMTKNPFMLEGEKWKQVRTKVGPALSSGRMKMMFPQMVRVSKRLVDYIKNTYEDCNKDGIYAKELCSKYTVDSVASCALSIDVKSFEDPKSEFREMGRKIFDTEDYRTTLKFLLFGLSPKIANFFGFSVIPKDIGNFFLKLVKEQKEHRKNNNLLYNDFMDFMIDLQKKCKEFEFDEIYMASQIISFFTDGFETSSVAMSFILYEIAMHPHVQNQLREEIEDIIQKNNGEMTYDGVMQDMKYLDCVVNETLRLRTPVVTLQKKCTAPYKLPPPKDGVPGIDVEPGIMVCIPTYAVMRDPKYFPNPEHFDPDRFSDERKQEIVKNTFLTFGDGPRQCIGMRFALMQIKVGIVAIVREFDVRLHPRTKVPFEEDPTGLFLKPKGGIWLTFVKRKQI